ncbi:MAG: tetratricopeptide repeat protein, partial [Thermodesulfobacteriota bacterium]|nr:tetratricopeptide repeat protein [Thermodesulfobacteriota bacterium]
MIIIVICGFYGISFADQDGESLTRNGRIAMVAAQEAQKQGDIKKAEEFLLKFISNYPGENHHFIEFFLANLFIEQNLEKKAFDHLKKCVELSPLYGPGWQNLGKICFDIKEYNMAALAMEKSFEIQEKNRYMFLFHAAIAHISAKNPQKALEHMRFLTSGQICKPKKRWIKLLVSLSIEQNCPEKALVVIKRLLKENGPKPCLFKLAANLHLGMKNYRKAAESFSAYAMCKKNICVKEQILLGDLYNQIGLPCKAALFYKKAAKRKPSKKLYEKMVSAWLDAYDYDQALTSVEQGLISYPAYSLWKMKGWICYGKNDFSNAADAFSHACKFKNHNSKSIFMLGVCAKNAGQIKTAIKALKKASQYPEHKKHSLALIMEMETEDKQI